MKQKLTGFLRRFRRDEDGHMIIEFALLVPLVFTMFMTSVELGIYQVRQMFLDRGLDMAVRQVRLKTGSGFEHDDVKELICKFSGFLEDCDTQLKLEMVSVDIRTFTGFQGATTCTDAAQPVQPSTQFKNGVSNQTMLLIACYKFDPVFRTSGLGLEFSQSGDSSGMSKMVSVSAFVQEP